MMPEDVERDGHPRAFATMEAAAAANSMRAEHLEAAYRLAAKRGDTVEAMLARAEARGRQLALELAQAHDELRGMRVAAARREVEVAANAQANTPPRHAAAWTAAPHAVPPAGLPGWMAEHLRQLDGKLEALSQQALRDRSPAARDLLARIASAGYLDCEDLLAFIRAVRRWPALLRPASLRPAFNADGVARLGLVLGNQKLDPGDGSAALDLYRFLLANFGESGMSHADKILFVDLLTHAGMLREAQTWLGQLRLMEQAPVDHACLLANTLHPGISGDAGPESTRAWLVALNAIFTQHGLEAVRIADGEHAILHRLECALSPEAMIDGPLVSVLMTTFEPDATVATAIRSVLGQSWRNLELIIVDDASSEQSYALLRRLAETDRRIVLMRNDTNQGTYVAKNRGLNAARGEFVTCHDSDDWSHPRKIERQVAGLIDRAEAPGNISFWVRTTDDVRFQRFSPEGRILYINTSSLMFRRSPVLERCGYFDSVRTGADTEYYKRIEIVFGRRLPRFSACPLSFGQLREKSLTGSGSGGMSSGWISPLRRNYRSAWEHWHKSVVAAGGTPYVPQRWEQRAFPAPAALLPERSAEKLTQRTACEIVLVMDFRSNDELLAGSIRAEARSGKRIALCHVNSLRGDLIQRVSIDPIFQQLLHEGTAAQVVLNDDIACRLLLVHDARVLQFLTAPRSGIEAGKVCIVSGARAGHGGAGPGYDVDTCSRVAARIFGREAKWLPAGTSAHDLCCHECSP